MTGSSTVGIKKDTITAPTPSNRPSTLPSTSDKPPTTVPTTTIPTTVKKTTKHASTTKKHHSTAAPTKKKEGNFQIKQDRCIQVTHEYPLYVPLSTFNNRIYTHSEDDHKHKHTHACTYINQYKFNTLSCLVGASQAIKRSGLVTRRTTTHKPTTSIFDLPSKRHTTAGIKKMCAKPVGKTEHGFPKL